MNDFKILLEELNTWLKENDLTIDITVIGAYALILHGILNRYTIDIDTISEIKDEKVLHKIQEIGTKYGLGDWLNDNAENIIMPDGYENRLILCSEFSNIIIRYVSRRDLIKLKVAAFFYRHEYELKDLSDLKQFKPTEEEINTALQFLLTKHKPDNDRFLRQFQADVRTISKVLLEICHE